MIVSGADFLTLEVALPSRWVLGEARQVRIQLRNDSGLDITHLQWRPCWEETVEWEAEGCWRALGRLRRQSAVPLDFRLASPSSQGEEVFQLHLRGQVGQVMEVEWWSVKMVVEVRAKPMQGDMTVIIKDSSIQGERLGIGSLGTEGGAGVGHVVNLHGVHSERDFEAWLRADPWVDRWRALALHLAKERCLAWTTSQEIEMVGIPQGDFKMGAGRGDALAEPEEKPSRCVSMTRGFWMSQYPITMSMYSQVMGSLPPVAYAAHRGDDCPAACMTWDEAVAFCEQLTCLEHGAHRLPNGYAFRLPTEAEWEYACRAGTEEPHYGPLEEIGALKINAGGMGAVGRFQPNAWGLYDMLGLVFEWCQDAFGSYRGMDTVDPVRHDPDFGQPLSRVVRGGCYESTAEFARASSRYPRDPVKSSHRIGFRVVLAKR
jgi:formylglycine-generating enzyme required for sulfatase activity